MADAVSGSPEQKLAPTINLGAIVLSKAADATAEVRDGINRCSVTQK
jgi:hypothetical protein